MLAAPVRPEPSLLVAIIIAVCAVLTAGGAVLLVRWMRGVERSWCGGVRRSMQASVQVSRTAAGARDRLERATHGAGADARPGHSVG